MSGETTACPSAIPEVLKKQYGKIIVVDEFFNIISDKMRTLDHNEIVLLVTHNFPSEWTAKSKGFLFEQCHTGKDKDAKNVYT